MPLHNRRVINHNIVLYTFTVVGDRQHAMLLDTVTESTT